MPFKPKQTYSESDERDQQSVDFVNGLLKGTSAYPELEYGDKKANIDGYIQLLDDERCIDGKLTVQVKTVSPCDEGKYVYDCPTSLFAYAERTLDVVFLMAVDHSLGVVLWKYISRPLINENQEKSEQGTIALHFDINERLSKDNLPETIKRWKSLFLQQRDLIVEASDIKEQNEKLRHQLVTTEAPEFTLPNSDIVKIQQFSDAYNGILDREFQYVKRCCYPNTWKQGIAILDYQDAELLYAMYAIHYGENSLLIKQIPKDALRKKRYDYASHSLRENKIKNDIPTLVKEKITDDVKRFFSKTKIIPPYDNYIIEYVQDFVHWHHGALGITKENANNYLAVKKAIERYCEQFEKIPNNITFIGHRVVNLYSIYSSIDYLLNRGYKGDEELFNLRSRYANTGIDMVWYDPETALKKIEIVFRYVYQTYSDFIAKNFPYIKDQLDMFSGADFVLISIDTQAYGISSMINYFYRIDGSRKEEGARMEFCLKQEHELYKQVDDGLASYYQFVGQTVQYKGYTYECRETGGLDVQKILYGRMNFLETFYDVFQKRLENYVENMHIAV